MILPLPHKTLKDYLRDFQAGTLEKFCPEVCPLCRGLISFFAFRKRKIIGIYALRGRCQGRLHYFTFLPLFVAPAKWFGYQTIEEALKFVNQGGFPHPTAAFAAWEERRETRIEEGQTPGPSNTSVRRWQSELGQKHSQRPWEERADQALFQVKESGVESLVAPESPNFQRSFPARLLTMLMVLGDALLGPGSFPPVPSVLGIGLWFLESRFQQRCLARFALAENVVPGPGPDLSVTGFFRRGYPGFS